MDTPDLQDALGVIWTNVYWATRHDRHSSGDLRRLENAVETVSRKWEPEDPFWERAQHLSKAVQHCGVFSKPYQRPHGCLPIITDCEQLLHYLEFRDANAARSS
jgi:hypothetical protein